MSPLVDEAEALEGKLRLAHDAYYVDHPYLDRVPVEGSGKRRRKLLRIIERARRRVNRRKSKAGIYIPISGTLSGLINSRDSSWF